MATQARSGLVVARRKVAELAQDPANARRHNEKNLAAIKASLLRFGQQKPIVVDSGGVVRAGNGTLAAAQALGWTEIDCVISDLKGAEATAYAIADNRTAELAEWDEAALTATLQSLEHEDATLLEAAGFDDKALNALVAANSPEVTEDEVPEPPAIPITKPGDLWLLGEHRLLCGDSTKAEDVGRVLGGGRIGILWSDPPYGLGGYAGRGGTLKPVQGDEAGDEALAVFYSVGKADEEYVCCEFKTYRHVLATRGVPRSCIVWAKPHFGMGRGYRRQHEFICYWGRFASTTESDLWSIGRDGGYDHPTQKPVALVARALRNSGAAGTTVFDPFCGSGPSASAAEQLCMRLRAIEIDPAYCDVIVARWEKLTGKKATLEQ